MPSDVVQRHHTVRGNTLSRQRGSRYMAGTGWPHAGAQTPGNMVGLRKVSSRQTN